MLLALLETLAELPAWQAGGGGRFGGGGEASSPEAEVEVAGTAPAT